MMAAGPAGRKGAQSTARPGRRALGRGGVGRRVTGLWGRTARLPRRVPATAAQDHHVEPTPLGDLGKNGPGPPVAGHAAVGGVEALEPAP